MLNETGSFVTQGVTVALSLSTTAAVTVFVPKTVGPEYPLGGRDAPPGLTVTIRGNIASATCRHCKRDE